MSSKHMPPRMSDLEEVPPEEVEKEYKRSTASQIKRGLLPLPRIYRRKKKKSKSESSDRPDVRSVKDAVDKLFGRGFEQSGRASLVRSVSVRSTPVRSAGNLLSSDNTADLLDAILEKAADALERGGVDGHSI
jgi:hypothetical protein